MTPQGKGRHRKGVGEYAGAVTPPNLFRGLAPTEI
jgi:hypothetical protein